MSGEPRGLFQLGKYWLDREQPAGNIYRYWYDPRTRKIRRRSLKEQDLEKAKLRLAEIVLSAPPESPGDPKSVAIITVFNSYLDHHGDHIVSAAAARRAVAVVMDYFDSVQPTGTPRVADFSRARQHGFMRWCRDAHGLGAKSISIYMSTIKAAFNRALEPQLVESEDGEVREVQLLDTAPKVFATPKHVCDVTELPASKPRSWIPTDQQLATYLDALELEHHFRYVIMALNTWARPEAIIDLSIHDQVDFERGLIDLNQPGRRQTKKHRPTIRLTENLRGWLLYWDVNYPIRFNDRPVKYIDKTLRRIAGEIGLPRLTPYALRHYMATRVRRSKRVSREQRAQWLGHRPKEFSTTDWYETFDPEFLEECSQETDAVLATLDQLTQKSLFAPKVHPKRAFTVIAGGQ